jgi:hypothetical protein
MRGGDDADVDADAWEDALYDHEEQLLRERKNRHRGYRGFAIAISVILVLIGVIILIAYFAGAFRNAGTMNGDANGRYSALLGERFTGSAREHLRGGAHGGHGHQFSLTLMFV